MINPSESNCTGCNACFLSCPSKAIDLVANECGFIIPNVDINSCVECGICDKVCPQKNNLSSENMEKTYAFVNLDDEERRKSTSGGFFIAAAKYVIKNGGFVCGCVLKNMMPIHVVSNNIDEIYLMQGSKYVQSDIGDCYRIIGELLKSSIPVLFTGTSCQVAGLKKYIEFRKIDSSLLLCVDFICHGVPSPKIWGDYVKYYEKYYKRNTVDYKFRSKKYGWGKTSLGGDFYSSFIYKSDTNVNKIDDKTFYSRLWRYIFFSNLCLREVCYECRYTSLNKPSDITMADFWGVEYISPSLDDGKGCSLIVCNTINGLSFLKKIENANIVMVNKKDAIKCQFNAHRASLPSELKGKFWSDYLNCGFEFVLNEYFGYNMYGRIKGYIKRVLFKLKIRYLF